MRICAAELATTIRGDHLYFQAEIADTLGDVAANVHFEDRVSDGRMTFDYRLKPGVVRKSNALELMRGVGLSV